MSKHTVQRPRHLAEIQSLDEQARVSDLPAAAAAHETPKLLLLGASLPRRLLLESAEGPEVPLSVDDLLHRGGTKSADQLVLQVGDAYVETQSLHIGASELGTEAGPLETPPEVALLCGVTEARKLDVKPVRTEQTQEPSYGLRAPNWHDADPLGVEVATTALGQRLERALVADPFNQHDRTCGRSLGRVRAREAGKRRPMATHGKIFAYFCGSHRWPICPRSPRRLLEMRVFSWSPPIGNWSQPVATVLACWSRFRGVDRRDRCVGLGSGL
jgi:hypothetical protein